MQNTKKPCWEFRIIALDSLDKPRIDHKFPKFTKTSQPDVPTVSISDDYSLMDYPDFNI